LVEKEKEKMGDSLPIDWPTSGKKKGGLCSHWGGKEIARGLGLASGAGSSSEGARGEPKGVADVQRGVYRDRARQSNIPMNHLPRNFCQWWGGKVLDRERKKKTGEKIKKKRGGVVGKKSLDFGWEPIQTY